MTTVTEFPAALPRESAPSARPPAPAHAARRAVRRWLAAQSGLAPAEPFPFGPACAHLRAAGRLDADPGLVADLRAAAALVAARPAAAGPDRLLAAWLRSATDQDDGTYDTYLAADLLALVRGAPAGESPGEAGDLLLTALVTALAAEEAAASAAGSASGARRRAAAAAGLAARAGGLAPTARRKPAVPDVSRAVRLSLLPLTPVPDELMFLRAVQIFEVMYQQCAERVIAATGALARQVPAEAAATLDDAAARLAGTAAVYRVLTLMAPAAFALIRERSQGRSAIQSRGYRLVEAASAGQEPGGPAPWLDYRAETLQDRFLRWSARAEPTAVRQVAASLARLDTAWRSMKRTHWGITRKMIGSSPGTGGTAGIAYLAAAAARPLFPAVSAPGTGTREPS